MQAVRPLAGGGALKLTVARFTLAGGMVVNGRGHPIPTILTTRAPGRRPRLRAALIALRSA